MAGWNHLEDLPASLGQLASLSELDLWGGNCMEVLPEHVGQLQGLTKLDLHGNELE